MERTSSHPLIQRFSGHKKDDGHLAADPKSKDLNPLIRVVKAGLQEGLSSGVDKVLFLKQDTHDKPFLTTHFDTPRQNATYGKPSLRTSQHLDATAAQTQRAVYWMNKLPNQPRVQAAGAALIELCASAGTTEFGLACTASLRDLLQELHDAINAPEPQADAVGRQHSAGGRPGVFTSLRRSLTIEKKTGSRVGSREGSPEKTPRGPAQSPRVSFAYDADVHYLPASPRRPPATSPQPGTPRLGQERPVAPATPDDPRSPATPPPGRSLPPLPTAALGDRSPGLETASPHSPTLVLTRFESQRARPRPSLPTPSSHTQRPPQPTRPGTLPREPD